MWNFSIDKQVGFFIDLSCDGRSYSKLYFDKFARDLKKMWAVFMEHHEKVLNLAGFRRSKIQILRHGTFRLSLVLCSEDKIKQLNNQYRGKNKVTDVLSFPIYDFFHSPELLPVGKDVEIDLGDIYICVKQAERQAEKFKISSKEEIFHLFVHGYLHLMGIDHERSLFEEILMEDLEEKILKSMFKALGTKKVWTK